MASVSLRHVKKIYPDGLVAVNDINLEVKDKEFLVFVGPSGCGKSTTLRMIAGLEDPTEGTIAIDGRVVNGVPPKDRDIAMVFQNYALYPHMSVFENMAFGLTLRKIPRGEIRERVHQTAAILGLTEYLDKKPKVLSGGQRQRVAVGRAIVRKPKVFLFDEPLSNLDAKLRVQMRMEISRLHATLGTTMIYVTHDQTEAMTMGERLVLMKDGEAQQIDTPLGIYHHPVNRFVAGFIGTPSMNFFTGTVTSEGRGVVRFDDGNGISFPFPRGTSRKLAGLSGGRVVMGLRPEHISYGTPASRASGVKVRVKVEALEPMGSETYIHFAASAGAQTHIARTPGQVKVKVGGTVDLIFDLQKAHFFDTAKTTESGGEPAITSG